MVDLDFLSPDDKAAVEAATDPGFPPSAFGAAPGATSPFDADIPPSAFGAAPAVADSPVTIDAPTSTDVSGAAGVAPTTVVDPLPTEAFADFPGGFELWNIDGVMYMVWFIPNTDPPIPLLYEITEDVETGDITGIPVKRFSEADITAMGALDMGSARLIDNADQHPVETFLDVYEAELEIKPWLEDPEIMGLMFGAFLEGRNMTTAELQGTEWWRTHSKAERQWAYLFNTDPATAEDMAADARINTENALIAAGVDDPPQGLIDLIAHNTITGLWTVDYANSQIAKLSDPFAPGDLDPAITDWVNNSGITINTTIAREADVRDMVSRWLGPAFSSGWTDDDIAHWGGEFRNNPDAEDELREALRAQRMALYPQYTNDQLTYNDIAAPWRGFYTQQWGQQPDETDPFFQSIIALNDAEKAAKMLRQEGLAQGNQTVVMNAMKAFSSAFGGALVRSDPAVR